MLFMAILFLGFLEVVGIASIFPFMELLSKPDAIEQSSRLTALYEFFQFDSKRSFLIAMGVFVIMAIALSNIFSIITTYIQHKISWSIAHRKGLILLETYMNKPYSYFLNQNTSDLRAYLISEVAALTSGILTPLIEFVSKSIICLTIFGLLLWFSPQITLTMFICLAGAYLLIYVSRQKFLKRLGSNRIQANVDRYRFLEEMLTGVKTLKIYRVQEYFYERYKQASEQFCDIQPKVKMVYATPKYLLELLAFGGILAVTLYVFITMGDLAKAIPRLSLYAVAGYRLLPSLQNAFSSIAKVRHSMPTLDKLYDDLIEGKQLVKDKIPATKPIFFHEKIKLLGLGFNYEKSERKILNNISMTINKGQRIAFVGSTGSGKTTLVDIITGLLKPNSGQIIIDDILLTNNNMVSWQDKIAYVPQEVFLYDETIRANIAIGKTEDEIDHNRLDQVLHMANLHSFVNEDLENGMDTIIGERGLRLSGGQRQRLGLARALYRNPELLILDEATSALDSITEKSVMTSLDLLPQDLTIIIIAHRISTVKNLDKIFMLENGSIVNDGIYRDLIESNDTFKKMVQLS